MTGNVLTKLPTLPALPGWNSVRGRMAIVLAVPTCLLLVLTGLGVADRAADWSAARGTEAQVGTAPTRFLGHHVVGALASRLGARVELRPTAGSGVTAYVALPAALVQEPSSTAMASG